ncbi:hypothetical protein TGAM01_v207415 [Trichoderma gamsii]|uniref:Uncharacterized protein n=1 Tax=Trichoderma gamsii TaxID=398673 RepID=A0A2P4ZHL9_9HYPO|nr:hypothetical protein TGAM01_v207415 [Trichoderma gamsii]PON23767.1 hypothetical protein TGAM01_v207415 [Trichoderma gamsii]
MMMPPKLCPISMSGLSGLAVWTFDVLSHE